MWYILIVIFLAFSAFLGSRLICNQSQGKSNMNNQVKNYPLIPEDTIKPMFSRKQLNQKLKQLTEAPPPANLSYGAMCYSVAFIKNMIHEYICPVCGDKTIYTRETEPEKFQYIDMMLNKNLYQCRREVSNIKGINIALDEKEFCKHCSPNTKRPTLYLLINIEGEPDTNRTSSFDYMDIRAINEFLNDKLIHKGSQDMETPLVDFTNEIKELLGLK